VGAAPPASNYGRVDSNHEDATQAFLRRTQRSTVKRRGKYTFR